MSVVLGADIGGTFTDVVLSRADGSLHAVKQLSSPEAPERSVLDAVARALAESGVAASEVQRAVHGTTLATNAVIERKGARVAFLTTAGFGDLLRIGREARIEDERYDLHFLAPPPPLPRRQIFEVPERMNAQGQVLRALEPDPLRALCDAVAAIEPEAVAICLLHAYANPAHEDLLLEVLSQRMPEVTLVASSRVHPEIREFDRATTTLFTAEVAPLMSRYLTRLARGLTQLGIHAPLQIMDSSGGVMAAAAAAARAVATLESGGAAGVMAAARFARPYDFRRVISFDMGGTTAKAGVVHDGSPRIARELHVGGRGSFGGRRAGTGLPVKTATIDLAEVGAGGGSIAWLDPEGILRVGPQSAGSEPGPACYGLGGELPTVTDANLVLGYLDPQHFAGDTLKLDTTAAHEAIEKHIARPLGVDVQRAAWSIHDGVNAQMASAIHVVTVQQGLDPREHALIAFGGAGPMHAVGVASRFEIASLLAPPMAGVASAIGMQDTDLSAEHGRSVNLGERDLDADTLQPLFAEIEAGAREKMGFDARGSDPEVERFLDARHEGQSHALSVSLASLAEDDLGRVVANFRAAYQAAYGVVSEGAVEFSACRVRLRVRVERPPFATLTSATGDAEPARRGKRQASFGPEPTDTFETDIFSRGDLCEGDHLPGPNVIEGTVETVVVPPGWQARVDEIGSILISRSTE